MKLDMLVQLTKGNFSGMKASHSPTTQATRHPRALFTSLFPLPPYYCRASCIRSVPPLSSRDYLRFNAPPVHTGIWHMPT